MKKLTVRLVLVLAMMCAMLIGSLCVASAEGEDNKEDGDKKGKGISLDFLEEEDTSGILDKPTETVMTTGRAVYKFIVIGADIIMVIMIAVLGISLAIGSGDPTNRKRMKSLLVGIVLGFIFVNGAVAIANMFMGISFSLFG